MFVVVVGCSGRRLMSSSSSLLLPSLSHPLALSASSSSSFFVPLSRSFHLAAPMCTLWQNWMNHVWNRMDESRLKLIGADRLACEWTLRMGGRVRTMKGSDVHNTKWYTDYNSLPWLQVTTQNQLPDIPIFVTEVDLSDASDTQDPGLLHLERLPKVEIVSLRNCQEITDSALEHLTLCPLLRRVDLVGTGVTEGGVCGFLSKSGVKTVVVDAEVIKSGGHALDPRIIMEQAGEEV
eukprot:m.99973 g.99973  ORF g.99973 m.99973 type:complete len:236 (-) comp9036_c4_seq2:1076-1783(-)